MEPFRETKTPRAVVTDLDGTVIDQGTATAATLDAAVALAAQGIPLIAATARTPVGVSSLESLVPHFTIAVCCGGSFGWEPRTGETLWREDLPAATVEQIVAVVTEAWPDAGIAAYDGGRWMMTEAYASRRWAARKGATEIVPASAYARRPVCAMSICHPRHSSDEMRDMIISAGIDPAPGLNYGAANLLDVVAGGIDKGTGVRRALAMLGVDPADALAFGDMPNDLSMFELCGRSVAMGNAHHDVLAAASVITDSVTDDGFSNMLVRLGVIGPRVASM